MKLTQIIGKKIGQSQGFLENGKRVPMSKIWVEGNVVSQIKTTEKDGYNALQIGFGTKRKTTKAIEGHSKKAGLKQIPRFFREIRVDSAPENEIGSLLDVLTILEPGDIVDVSGVSKGKGFAGVVKRHNFRGGPRTHGQSDRERAPGSSGQTTTPGRVYKGKRMAGHMGVDNVTIKNLQVLEISNGTVIVKGLVPGIKGQLVTITRVSKSKKFTPIYKGAEAIADENLEDTKVQEVLPEAVDTEEVKVATKIEEPKPCIIFVTM